MPFRKISRNFKYRIAISTILIITILALIYFSYIPLVAWLYTAATAAIASHALLEYYQLGKAKGYHPQKITGVATTFLFIFFLFAEIQYDLAGIATPFLFSLSLLTGFIFAFSQRRDNAIVNLAITYFGIVYITLPLSCAILINFIYPQGWWWILYALFLTKISDTGAYFFGKTIGKHTLISHVSPKKTWEGSIGGLLFPLAFSPFIRPPSLSVEQSLLFAAGIGILAELGDLAESLLKRDAKVKDSNQLPGLGGTLDIVDSLLFTLPFTYLILRSLR